MASPCTCLNCSVFVNLLIVFVSMFFKVVHSTVRFVSAFHRIWSRACKPCINIRSHRISHTVADRLGRLLKKSLITWSGHICYKQGAISLLLDVPCSLQVCHALRLDVIQSPPPTACFKAQCRQLTGQIFEIHDGTILIALFLLFQRFWDKTLQAKISSYSSWS